MPVGLVSMPSIKASFGRKLLDLLAGSPVPAEWIYPSAPGPTERSARRGRLHIELVSHCWQYSNLLSYQLHSLLQQRIEHADITYTLFYNDTDRATVSLLELIKTRVAETPKSVPANQALLSKADPATMPINWNFRPLPKPELFRRAIGRNRAALATRADWIWFTDCDLVFLPGCLDGLAAALQGRTDALVFPAREYRTIAYTDQDTVRAVQLERAELKAVDADELECFEITRATGPLQITHGDVARAVGYCRHAEAYLVPATERFQKCTEDRVFRWMLGTQGVPLEIPGVCRIQHADKGRYRTGSSSAKWRKWIRTVKYRR